MQTRWINCYYVKRQANCRAAAVCLINNTHQLIAMVKKDIVPVFHVPLFNWKHENLLNRTWPTEDPRMNAAIIKRSAQDKTIKFVLFNFQVLQNPPRSAMPVCGCRYAARRKSYWNGVDNCFLCKKARYLGSGLFKFKRKASSSVGGSSDRRGKNGISM